MHFCGKKITVVGLGVSGMSAAKLLMSKGADVRATELLDNDQIREQATKLRQMGARVECGRHTREFILGSDLVIASPGVSANSEVLRMIQDELRIHIISEIELAWSQFDGQIVAITGTNGKTTVTTLVGQILRDSGKDVVVCGNIGNPFSGEIGQRSDHRIAVLEVSSFQLEWITNFRPSISMILNVGSDHLDRYRDFDHYLQTKLRIFSNQTEEDFCCLNEDDPHLKKLISSLRAKVLTFDQGQGRLDPNEKAAMLVGTIYGLTQDQMIGTIEKFEGIEHRLEEVATIDGIRFINDSKATNPDATRWALSKVKGPVALIAGGRDKGSDFRILKYSLRKKVKALILCGEATTKMKEALDGVVPIKETSTFEEAFWEACEVAMSGDCVLLSPACASYDMFNNFEARGKAFKDLVQKCKGHGLTC